MLYMFFRLKTRTGSVGFFDFRFSALLFFLFSFTLFVFGRVILLCFILHHAGPCGWPWLLDEVKPNQQKPPVGWPQADSEAKAQKKSILVWGVGVWDKVPKYEAWGKKEPDSMNWNRCHPDPIDPFSTTDWPIPEVKGHLETAKWSLWRCRMVQVHWNPWKASQLIGTDASPRE